MSFLKKFLLIFLLSQTRANDQTYDAFVSNTIAQKCPNQRSCPREGHNNNVSNPISSCCQQCSCDTGCKIREACCLDQQANPTESSDRNLACRTALFSKLKFGPEYRYLVVDTCPVGYKKKSITRNCHGSSPKTFEQAQIVSDSQGIIFKNSYCAVCNGEHTFNRWLTRIDCEEQLDIDVYDAELKFWLEHHCRVWFEEPKDEAFIELRCYSATIETCNITHKWSTYDPYIDKACSTLQTGRYVPKDVVYKNIFCFLCNQVDDEKPTCYKRKKVMKSAGFSFSAILNRPMKDYNSDTTVKHCGGGEVYDYFKDVCRRLECSSLNFPSHGQCVPMYDELVGFVFEMSIHLRPTSQRNVTTLDRPLFVSNTIESVKEQFEKLNVYKCDVCSYLGVFDASVTDGWSNYVFIHLSTLRDCQPAQVDVIATSFKGLELNVSSKRSDYQFITHIIAKTPDQLNVVTERPGLTTHSDTILLCEGKRALYENMCPHVELNGVDYLNALEKNYIDRNKHRSAFIQLKRYSPEELEQLKYDVCIDEYMALDDSLAGVNSFEKIKLHSILLAYINVFIQCCMFQ